MEDLNIDKVLEEFRISIKDLVEEYPEDYHILNLLRAANYDQEKAKIIFNQFIGFRFRLTNSRKMNLSDCFPAEEVTSDMIYKTIGRDAEGRLVIWIPAGRWEVRKLFQRGFKTDVFKQIFKIGDTASREVYEIEKETGKAVHVVGFLDLKELTFKKLASYDLIQFCLELSRMADILAALLDIVYIVNAPKVCNYLLSVVRPVLSSSTVRKLEFLGPEEKNWQEPLKQRLPMDVIPIEYGGLGPKVFV